MNRTDLVKVARSLARQQLRENVNPFTVTERAEDAVRKAAHLDHAYALAGDDPRTMERLDDVLDPLIEQIVVEAIGDEIDNNTDPGDVERYTDADDDALMS